MTLNFNDPTLLWIIVGAVVALAAIVTTALVVRNRRVRELERRDRPSIETPTAPPATPSDGVLVEEPVAPTEPAAPTTERPEAAGTRLSRLRRRLAGSNNVLAQALLGLISTDRLDADTWDDFEATLIGSDLGVGPTTELVDTLRMELSIDGVNDPTRARTVLRQELVKLADPTLDRALNVTGADGLPAVVLVVGVNGTGKTTTVGKLARLLVAEGKTVLLGAADTFRAAAAEQLQTWGDRVGVETVRGPEGADPASVAYQTVERAVASACQLGVRYLTVHCSGGPGMLEAAARRAEAEGTGLCVLGVTVLTSLDRADLEAVGVQADPADQAERLARLAKAHGLGGLVCSSTEVGRLREVVGPELVLVTPGIRPAGGDVGDQKRVGTPAEAIRQGSSLLVVGRPIRDAARPALAARNILEEITSA